MLDEDENGTDVLEGLAAGQLALRMVQGFLRTQVAEGAVDVGAVLNAWQIARDDLVTREPELASYIKAHAGNAIAELRSDESMRFE